MAYSDFDLKKVTTDFGLTTVQNLDLFAGVPPVAPSQYLRDWLAEFAPVALGFGSELARSGYIITPVLAEAKRSSAVPVTVIPGLTLDVDRTKGLTGVCDFILSRSTDTFALRAPVFVAVEAKREDITAGIGQCAAEMVAIRLFNFKDNVVLPAVFGCVTTGSAWRFLKLEENTLYIDPPERYISAVETILGILVHIATVSAPVTPPSSTP
jgi:hypothetical protein